MDKTKKEQIENILENYGHTEYLITEKRIYVKGETDIEMAFKIRKVENRVKSIKSVWSNTVYFQQGYRTFLDLEN